MRQLVFEFKGMSFRTPARSREMLYTCRLEGYDEDWQPPTRDMRVHYQDLPLGEYVFEVKAIDRDLNYSEAVQVQISVEPDALVESLTTALGQSGPQGQFVGNSPALHHVQAQLRQVAPSDLTVLILGETGTGKGLAARILHELSPYRNKPFILVSCGGIPQPLMESELFGHEKGAFTGAASRRLGKVELAGDTQEHPGAPSVTANPRVFVRIGPLGYAQVGPGTNYESVGQRFESSWALH